MGGEQFKITEQEFKQISQVGSGLVFIKSCGSMINTSSISSIYPEDLIVENPKPQSIGVLHDGTVVKRQFGNWVLINQEYPDDKGNSQPITLDPSYYPEIAKDCVMTKDEYEKVKHLPSAEILKLTMQKRGRSEMSSLKSILETKMLD